MDGWTISRGSAQASPHRSRNLGEGAIPWARIADRALEQMAKRALDFSLAVSCLVILSWVLVVIAAGVALTSPGPILFRQRRTGLHGRVFTIYKFRTMTVIEDGDRIAHARRDDPRHTC